MLKKGLALLVTAMLLVGVPIACLSLSSNYQYCISHQGEHQANSQNQSATVINIPLSRPTGFALTAYCVGVFTDENASSITAISTLLLTVVTAGLVWLAYLQLANNRVQLRPHVFATKINSFWSQDERTGQFNWRFAPTWSNTGATPTRRLRTASRCEVRNSLLQAGFNPEANTLADDIATGLIPPQCANVGGNHPIVNPLSPQDIWDSQQGRRFIYLYGWVRYFDPFPGTREHVTRYCWQIVSVGDPFAFKPNDPEHPLTFNYSMYQYGNCADEECE